MRSIPGAGFLPSLDDDDDSEHNDRPLTTTTTDTHDKDARQDAHKALPYSCAERVPPQIQIEAMSSRSDCSKSQPPTLSSTSASSSSISSLSSSSSSSPCTPRRQSHYPPVGDRAFVGLLTPVSPDDADDDEASGASASASLKPAASACYKDGRHPASSPVFTLNSNRSVSSRHCSPLRRPCTPVTPTRRSLSVQVYFTPASRSTTPMASSSRPASPHRRSRPLSPTRPDPIPRPPSRCESLLRDTLRRADDYERHQTHRSASRSPGRYASQQRKRSRGNSFLGMHGAADEFPFNADGDCDSESEVFAPNGRGSFNFLIRVPPPSAPRVISGMTSGSVYDAASSYGSPSSPSPFPPSMLRTRTAPAVSRTARPSVDDDEQHAQRGSTHTPPSPPRAARHSLPNTAIHAVSPGPLPQGQSSTAASTVESSPKLRPHALSPHEAVLRAKLECVLSRAGSDEKYDGHSLQPGRSRNHQRSQSYGVTIVPTKGQDDAASVSPKSLAASSLSNSASDLAKLSSTTPSYRRYSVQTKGGTSSPSSPSEPMTPPPTPPFNARTASEVCKRMDGYISFASVEGLGEPPGMDIDGGEIASDGTRGIFRFFRWPFASQNDVMEHETAQIRGPREASVSR